MISDPRQHLCRCLVLLFLFWGSLQAAAADDAQLRPEQDQINRILAGPAPEGVVFLVMEHDQEALQWVLPRVADYTRQLRGNWPKLPVVLISHGDEMFALRSEYEVVYPEIHRMARRLVEEQEVLFNVCEAWASNEGVVWTEFPRFVDVVPFAPAEIENYRALEYRIVSVEQTW